MYDLIIIGGGPAGLTAALYAGRKQLKTLVISMDIGGQTNLSHRIENYPGIEPMPGVELMQKFHEQATRFGAEIISGDVTNVCKKKQGFLVRTIDKEYESKTVILAFGKVPRILGVLGEQKFIGRGVSTCVTCDAVFYKNKIVAVVGGGNSAIEGLVELSKIAKKVYLIHRREGFRADETSLEKAKELKDVEFILNTTITEFKGDKFLKSVMIENVKTKEKKELKLDGVFLEIGFEVGVDPVKALVKTNKRGEIIVDKNCKTNCAGMFAAGDVTDIPYKQAVISAGDGAKAALEAHRFITGTEGISVDWRHKRVNK